MKASAAPNTILWQRGLTKHSRWGLFICSMVFPFLSLFVTAAFCSTAFAAAPGLPPAEAPGNPEQRDEPALLEVFNRPIAVFRGSQFGYTPSKRVKGMAERIAVILDRKIYGPVASERRTEGIVITIGGEPAFAVLPGDIDPLAGKTLDETAQEIVQLLKVALQEAKHQRSKSYLLLAVAKATGATLVFLVLCLLLLRARRRLLPRLLNLEQRLAKRLSARGLVYLGQFVQVLRWMLHFGWWVLVLAFTSEWPRFACATSPIPDRGATRCRRTSGMHCLGFFVPSRKPCRTCS